MKLPVEDLSLLVVLAGPAGSGKTTLCERLASELAAVERVVTCTTRAPREGEEDGVDYHFLSDQSFDEGIAKGDFLEWAKVHTNRYGTLKSVIRAKLDQRIDLVMNVDVQGVANFQKAAREDESLGRRLVTVFILPESMEVIRDRLRGRGKDDEPEIARRIQTAEKEVTLWPEFDYVIVTKSKDQDYAALLSIMAAEKKRAFRLM